MKVLFVILSLRYYKCPINIPDSISQVFLYYYEVFCKFLLKFLKLGMCLGWAPQTCNVELQNTDKMDSLKIL